MANLQSLPAEIVVLITNHMQADKCPITPLAVTSRHCQMHVEPINFSRLSVRTAELADLSRMLVASSRFLALRNLTYKIDDIPSGDPEAGSYRISEDARTTYSAALTSSVQGLLEVLKEKGDSVGASHPGIRLELIGEGFPKKATWLDAPGDEAAADYQDAQSDADEEQQEVESTLRRAWLKLTEDVFPVVPSVTTLSVQRGYLSRLFEMVWPQSWTALASHLPSLKAIDMYAFDNERKASKSREQARKGM